ncbi:GNAT family N-acetyltransferase [Geofilum rubicundum]|uniref:Acetyltransferase n=1 Tax=Geofilum rubicundum JCM 15548 TaxID=1236989 RepID=A0A0E9LTH9_9BACT|nr:GNAT family N-acetyltransferase [Geofilum rubicundum]GAO28564.1 acetyltransferase [Geofilum rubicundum JCM 15548]
MNNSTAQRVTFQTCDFSLENHQQAFIHFINAYMQDPMGNARPLDDGQKQQMVSDLANHPSVLAIFILCEEVYAGLAVAFTNYSTFKAAHYLNVHDLIVDPKLRNKKLGRLLLNYLIDLAKNRSYCKVNLEVRTDNHIAQSLYRSLNFTECQPPMLFWEKLL